MTLQLLVSAVNKKPRELARQMQIDSDAILIVQCGENGYEEWEQNGHRIRAYRFCEKGVGLSRNNALLRADRDISVFADEDIVYTEGYEQKILAEFEKHPEADMLLFNVGVCEERRTYHIDSFGRVGQHNCGRYPAYSFAVRTAKLHQKNITFSLLFGGGAKYSNGEDSLFIRDCIVNGLKVYKVPVTIGEEIPRPSTWFHGYNEKFFFDRGVLYHYLYGFWKKPLAIRFLLKNKPVMCKEIPVKKAYALMKQGMREAAE
ncbi:MAG: glycosyltransferase family 2 protein [Lachnospiraceae bacterium]|nr:glycosyltransferase family 2 protein [Lachnospiraceae bacterium]